MTITVNFFASLRDSIGIDSNTVDPTTAATAADVWRISTDGKEFPPNTLIAINMEYADSGQPVKDGDEVAFFPPVTGG